MPKERTGATTVHMIPPMHKSNIETFADNITILTKSENLIEVALTQQELMEIIEHWLKQWRTFIRTLSHNKQPTNLAKVKSQKVKYLNLHINKRLA